MRGIEVDGLTPAGRRWAARAQRPLDVLAVVFLVDLVLLWSFPGAPAWFLWLLGVISWAVWAAFAIDYVVRLRLASDRMSYLRGHKLDLLMVLLPMLRLLRVLLLLRRSLAEVSTDKIAGSIVSVIIAVMAVSAFLMWRAEASATDGTIHSFRQAIWWTVVTTTTVGYGDYTPVTPIGRGIAIVLMILGVGLIGTVSATVASWFVTRERERAGASGEATGTPEPSDTAGSGDVSDASREALLDRLDRLASQQAAQEAEIRSIVAALRTPDTASRGA